MEIIRKRAVNELTVADLSCGDIFVFPDYTSDENVFLKTDIRIGREGSAVLLNTGLAIHLNNGQDKVVLINGRFVEE